MVERALLISANGAGIGVNDEAMTNQPGQEAATDLIYQERTMIAEALRQQKGMLRT